MNITIVNAHGAYIEYEVDMSYELVARFASGEPMAEAQVTVYAPDNPSTAYLTGYSDKEGRFKFQLDTNIEGVWYIQIRQAGHGASVSFEVGENSESKKSGGYTLLQQIVMVACVLWGLMGTALYFKRRTNNAHS